MGVYAVSPLAVTSGVEEHRRVETTVYVFTLFLLATLLLYLSSLLAGLLSGYSCIVFRRLKTRLSEGLALKGFKGGWSCCLLVCEWGGGRA